eukprot:TRINITY_DN53306_c0_g1_i1.p1 TRINITY_DN53306_c0_g1~~TRINITY_DN53306_c0_g1_i1.p1  ORF type:complete len:222 (-),score=29.38 TRINITY_DN53306_c0_g1_i1:489-1154(-)
MFGIVGVPQDEATETGKNKWRLDFDLIGDPQHQTVQYLSEKNILHISTTTPNEEWYALARSGAGDFKTFEKGIIQPAILAITKSGRVLFRWSCVPDASNAQGGMGRPTPDHVWKEIQAALNKSEDAPHDHKNYGPACPPAFPFFLLMMAHGNFIKLKAFTGTRGQEGTWIYKKIAVSAIKLLAGVGVGVVAGCHYPLATAAVTAALTANAMSYWKMIQKAA